MQIFKVYCFYTYGNLERFVVSRNIHRLNTGTQFSVKSQI
jgi:hypothetical protein